MMMRVTTCLLATAVAAGAMLESSTIGLEPYVCRARGGLMRRTTPVHRALVLDQTTALSVLITAGCDVNAPSAEGLSPTLFAAKSGRTEALALLIAAGSDVESRSQGGATAIFSAALEGHLAAVSALIAAGSDVNAATTDGLTPAYAAAQGGHVDVLMVLVKAGAKLNYDGWTPAHVASSVEAVTFLVKAGADVNAHHHGVTPTFLAAQNGKVDILETLIENGADVNHRGDTGATPLYIAAYDEQFGSLELLVKAGANIDSPDLNGFTPLMIAASVGRTEVAKFLLAKGANTEVKSTVEVRGLKAGSTARDAARFFGHEDALFKQQGFSSSVLLATLVLGAALIYLSSLSTPKQVEEEVEEEEDDCVVVQRPSEPTWNFQKQDEAPQQRFDWEDSPSSPQCVTDLSGHDVPNDGKKETTKVSS